MIWVNNNELPTPFNIMTMKVSGVKVENFFIEMDDSQNPSEPRKIRHNMISCKAVIKREEIPEEIKGSIINASRHSNPTEAGWEFFENDPVAGESENW